MCTGHVYQYTACIVCTSLQNDLDMIDYVNELRESCLDCYTGIIQGLKGEAEDAVNRMHIIYGGRINNNLPLSLPLSPSLPLPPSLFS